MNSDDCFQIISESLSTHTQLKVEDVEWCAVETCSVGITTDQVIVLALLANRKTISGRYARLFNLTLRDIITKRSFERLRNLASKPIKELYPELYNNGELTEAQVEAVESIINREFNIFKTAFKNREEHIVPHVEARLPASIQRYERVAYEKAYEWVCVKEFTPTCPYLVKNVTVMDDRFNKHCYDRHELIKRLAARVYVDPLTGKDFPPGVLNVLLERFDTEIKLLQYDVTGGSRSPRKSVRWSPDTPLVVLRRSVNRSNGQSTPQRVRSLR